MSYKLGRLPATRPAALADLAVYAQGKLPTPPRTVEVPRLPYPIDGNASFGDCTIAGAAHLIEAWDAEVKEPDRIPTEEEVVDQYFTLTGGEDNGLNEAEVLLQWQREGLFEGLPNRSEIAAYAPVSPHRLLEQHQAIAFYGGLYMGIECPLSAQEQFAAGEPWTFVEGSEVEGGHCVVGLGYGPNGGIHAATWGGIAVLEASFLAHYLDEAWVVLSHQIVEAKKDQLGLDLKTLSTDLKRV